jgi:hypothetical protein
MQVFCDWRLMSEVAATLREISREMPVIVDHMLNIPARRGVNDAQFQALLRLVGGGHVHVKLSAAYRLSDEFPDYSDARPFHDALLRAFVIQAHFVLSRCQIHGELRWNLRLPQRWLNRRRGDCAATPSRWRIELGIFRTKFPALNRCTHTTHTPAQTRHTAHDNT